MNLFRKEKNNNAGFTLVEMIVVLIVLGILASVAIYGISAYIDMTRYNSNQQDAASIYQSAQAALTHMSENGTAEEWTKSILGDKGLNNGASDGIGRPDGFDSDNPDYTGQPDNIFNQGFFQGFPANAPDALPGESVHMRYAVTFTPGAADAQSNCIRDLLMDDFSATDIFKGVITIEFDIEKVLDSSGSLRLNASVYSVFYDSRRTAWDNVAYDTVAPATRTVPKRDETYRRSTSLVGYYTGKNGPTGVDSVYIPSDAEIKDIICTLRNGETLDLTWSAVSDSVPITGKTNHIHYTFSLYDSDKDGDNKICDLVVNENSLFTGIPDQTLHTANLYDLLKFDKNNFIDGKVAAVPTNDYLSTSVPVVYTKETIHDERMIEYNVYRASVRTVAKVFVHKATSSSYAFDYNTEQFTNLTNSDNYYSFPLTISYEIYEVKGGITVSQRLSYTLSLDAMMARNVIDSDTAYASNARTLNYSFNRLINGTKLENKLANNGFPVNLYATMSIEGDDFGSSHSAYNYQGTLAPSGMINAERALNDPVYLTSDGSYWFRENAAIREHGKGYAVVNSYFGDLNDGSVGTHTELGTNEAVITSFRHLYNIRMLEKNSTAVHYSILRDLNWYSSRTANKYTSDVVVYSIDPSNNTRLFGFSPVPVPSIGMASPQPYYGDVLNVVSFPSIPTLNDHSTLEAVDNTLADPLAEDKTSVINNMQMRLASFYNANFDPNKLSGYGMININKGVVINIRANAMTLVLNNVADGSPDDTADIIDAIHTMKTGNVNSEVLLSFQASSPLGGLIGANDGIVGSSDPSADEKKNTVKFSNCIVMSTVKEGGVWQVYEVSSCGVIIGDNNGNNGNKDQSVYGYLTTTGHFASASWIDVSGAIGYSIADIDAIITVDNTRDTDKAVIQFKDNVSSLIYASSDSAGGAIGASEKNCHYCQDASKLTSLLTETTGDVTRISEPANAVYAIDVNLDSGSYIIMKTNDAPKTDRPYGIGGAVGRIKEYDGSILSVRVINNGYIETNTNTNSNNVKNMGGAIGIIWNSAVTDRVDIVSVNRGFIGTIDTGRFETIGGAIGRIDKLGSAGATITILASNSGEISGDVSKNNSNNGVGGAIGVTVNSNAILPVCHIYTDNSGTISGKTIQGISGTADNKFGVGGVIGYIDCIPRRSSFHCDMRSGSSVFSNGNNAGGCIGSQSGVQSNAPNGVKTFITSSLSDGVSVRSTGSNAGGCIGNAPAIDVYTSINATISGTVGITSGSNVGGVCGRLRLDSGTTASSVTLTAENASSVLNIRAAADTSSVPVTGNENAGGLIGLVSSGGTPFAIALKMPSQSGADTVVLKVTSYDNAGGMIGNFNTSRSVSSDMNIKLHQNSVIEAIGSNAGGCIGRLQAAYDFTSDMRVETSSGLGIASTVKAGTGSAGGIIGYAIGNGSNSIMKIGSSLSLVANGGSIIGGECVGGCIGSLEENIVIGDSASVTLSAGSVQSSNVLTITGTERVGGLIGSSYRNKIYGTLSMSLDNLGIVGTNHVGGCIGRMNYGEIWPSATVPGNTSVEYSGANSIITGEKNIGGCIGTATNLNHMSGRIIYSGSDAHIIGTSEYTGGIIGSFTNCQTNDDGVMEFSGEKLSIAGTKYTGGIIGGANTNTIKNNSLLSFTATGASITGGDYTGGIIGSLSYGSTGGNTKVIFSGQASVIKGGNYTGGLIGSAGYTSFNDSTELTYSSEGTVDVSSGDKIYSTITGADNTGGLFGQVIGNDGGGYSGTGVKYNFTGKDTVITGNSNVGGIMGLSDAFKNEAVIRFSPVSECRISGTAANVGGIAGHATSRRKDGNLHKQPQVVIRNCTLTITGSGYTGGIVGRVDNNCYYSGGTVDLENSTMSVTSTGSAAGGNLGYLEGGRIGDGTYLVIKCRNSTLNIDGSTYAGGLAGEIKKHSVNNTTHPSITIDSSSVLNIKAGSAAGGLIGYNGNSYKPLDDIGLPSGGGVIRFNAPVKGVIIGINDNEFNAGNKTYTVNINSGDFGGITDKSILFGQISSAGSVKNLKYSINGSTVTTYTP